MSDPAHAAAEQAARASYGRLVAILASRSGDIAAAEDALSAAFATALDRWPRTGVPDNPQAWLLTAARNRMTDTHRRDARQIDTPLPEIAVMPDPADPLPDDRLKLMFVCAHCAIDPRLHAPLMLQCVLGVDADRIARAFLTSPSAMAQRLVRAKAKIKLAGIPFALPQPDQVAPRMSAVMEAIYGAFALDWMDNTDALTGEAQYLAALLARLAPDDPETGGLVALIGFIHARRAARVQDGVLVPPGEQDVTLWDTAMIDHAAHVLTQAQKQAQTLAQADASSAIGRFQLEAAIQSVHAHRAVTGVTDWTALGMLYAALMQRAPTLGAAVGQAAVLGETAGPAAALRLLDDLNGPAAAQLQAYHATRAHLLSQLSQPQQAATAYDRAIAMATDAPTRRFLEHRRAALIGLI